MSMTMGIVISLVLHAGSPNGRMGWQKKPATAEVWGLGSARPVNDSCIEAHLHLMYRLV